MGRVRYDPCPRAQLDQLVKLCHVEDLMKQMPADLSNPKSKLEKCFYRFKLLDRFQLQK